MVLSLRGIAEYKMRVIEELLRGVLRRWICKLILKLYKAARICLVVKILD